jgi:hypothetical protein
MIDKVMFRLRRFINFLPLSNREGPSIRPNHDIS